MQAKFDSPNKVEVYFQLTLTTLFLTFLQSGVAFREMALFSLSGALASIRRRVNAVDQRLDSTLTEPELSDPLQKTERIVIRLRC